MAPQIARFTTTGILLILTGLIFLAEVRLEFGLATWLPYFLLAIPVSRLYSQRVFLLVVGGWSLLITAKLLTHLPSDDLTTELFNRTLGIICLWITAYLLFQHRELGRLRTEDEQRVRTMLDGALDAVITINARSIITTWNTQAEKTFGFTSGEALGTLLSDLIIPPAFRDAHLKGLQKFLAKGGGPILGRRIEVTALHKDGREFPIELTVMPIRLEQSISFCAFARDITERKELESTLRRAHDAAEGASRAKSEFLANVSHEIRTPLNAICGTTDLLLGTALTSSQRRYAEMCAKATHTLLCLVTDLLDFSRIESGRMQLEIAPYDVHQIIDRTVQLLAHRAEEKGLTLSVHLDPNVPQQVEGDAFRLHQVLLNLIANALKFTDQGHVTVRVTVAQAGDGLPRMRVSVIDSGIGIPAEQLDHIFERFTQVDSASSRLHGGVGLGLAICKHLVELMGGRIWAESVARSGSTFIVDLPLAAADMPDNPKEPKPVIRSLQTVLPLSPSTAERQQRHVLLAEDSVESQELMRFYFQGTPYAVKIVSDGEQAVAAFQTGRFDIVLIDLQMPGMDGFTATRMIRAWESLHQKPATPILALTANALHDAEEQSLAAGCSRILTKPITKAQLFAALSQYGSPAHAVATISKEAESSSDTAARIEEEIERRRPKFLENRRKDLDLMRQAAADQDYEAIRTMGHRIKGLAGSYGFPDIGTVGHHLEQAARARDIKTVQNGIDHLAMILAQLHKAA